MNWESRWRWTRQEGEPGADGGTGADPAPTPEEPQPIMINPADLPEEFQGRSQDEIRLLVSRLPHLAKRQQERIQQLEQAGVSAPTPEKPEPAPADDRSFQERFEENPEKAILSIVQNQYSPEINRIRTELGAGAFDRVRNQFPQLKEHEDTVRQVIQQRGVEPTAENIAGVLAMVVGQKHLSEASRTARASAATVPAEPAPTPTDEIEVEITEEDRMMMRTIGIDEDAYKKLKADRPWDIKVPGVS